MTQTTLLTRNTLLLALLLLFSFTRVAGAGTKQGTCACRNTGFDTAGTAAKCWKTQGHPKATCTAIAMDKDTGNDAGACTGAGDCTWTAVADTAGFCEDDGGTNCTDAATLITKTTCDASHANCRWIAGSCQPLETQGTGGGATCTDITTATLCTNEGVGNDDCVWVTHTCECTNEGQTAAAAPTCFTAAASTLDLCSTRTTDDALSSSGCAEATFVPFCTWVAYDASTVPVTDTAGTCACVNPGYDSVGTTEKCWQTPGTAEALCQVAVDTAACTAASVNTGDCKWTAVTASCKALDTSVTADVTACTALGTDTLCGGNVKCFWHSGCGCETEGQNAAGVATCHGAIANDVAKAASFCSGIIGATATTKTACAVTATATHCKWLIAEAACPVAATPTPTPCPSSAVAPGALLAFLATALAFLRC